MRLGPWAFCILSALAAVGLAAGGGLADRFAAADSLLRLRRADDAAAILDSVRASAERRGAPGERLAVLLEQARLNGLVGRPKPGRESAAKALELASTLRDTLAVCRALRWLAVAAQHEGAMPEARICAQRLLELARAHGDRFHEGQGHLLTAYSDLVMGDVRAAEPEYEAAIPAFVEVRNLVFELMAVQGLGQILHGRGEVDGARGCFLRVLQGSRALADPFGEARALNDLGVLEFVYGDPSAAEAYYRQALELQVANGDLAQSAVAATNLAICHSAIGEYDEALALLTETRKRCEEAGYRGTQSAVLEEMGLVRRDQGEYREAAALFRRAADLARGSSPDQLGLCLVGLAEVLAFQDSIGAGLATLEEGSRTIRGLVTPATLFDIERMRGSLLLWMDRPAEALVHLRAADRIGRTLELSFLVGTLAYAGRCHDLLGCPDSAGLVLARAAEVWEGDRARPHDPCWREQVEYNGRRLYNEIARHIWSGNATTLTGERSGAAFDALQRFKARTLRERMLGAFSARPDTGSGPGATVEAIRASVTLSELQKRWLGPDELLLDFFLGDDAIYLFGVTRSECRALRVVCDTKELRRALLRYRELAAARPGPQLGSSPPAQSDPADLLDAAGRRLSTLVLSPVADLLAAHSRVALVLDGELNLVPVEAWPSPDDPKASGPPEPLFVRHRITRIPSATLWRDQRAGGAHPSTGAPRREVLALLGPEPPETGPGPRESASGWADRGSSLPGAANEVRWLRRSFQGVRVLPAADSAHWLAALRRCGVLHLASHVQVDDVHPWRSGLPELRAQQIAGLRLPAGLVFLAGCESAGGRLVSGEGVLGLTSAFVSASVPSVVATLWPVSDRATNRLARVFYSALADGRPVGEALRVAQQAVRADPRTRHPFYWAGFVLVGENGTVIPLQRRRMGPIALALAAGALSLGVIGRAWRLRSSRAA